MTFALPVSVMRGLGPPQAMLLPVPVARISVTCLTLTLFALPETTRVPALAMSTLLAAEATVTDRQLPVRTIRSDPPVTLTARPLQAVVPPLEMTSVPPAGGGGGFELPPVYDHVIVNAVEVILSFDPEQPTVACPVGTSAAVTELTRSVLLPTRDVIPAVPRLPRMPKT